MTLVQVDLGLWCYVTDPTKYQEKGWDWKTDPTTADEQENLVSPKFLSQQKAKEWYNEQ